MEGKGIVTVKDGAGGRRGFLNLVDAARGIDAAGPPPEPRSRRRGPVRYLSLFSGIEAATVAWRPLGWEPAAFAEIDPFCCELLERRYPGVPNLGDVTRVTRRRVEALGRVDAVVFGSPCQDLSVAGARKGMSRGTRSSLFFTAVEVFRWSRARFALWENVPGALGNNGGRDFAAVVGSLCGMADVPVPAGGWRNEGVALGPLGMLEWCVLDAQWRGVAQRRRRVFALLDAGDWAGRPPVLLEPASMRGDPPARGAAGKDVAPPIAGCSNGGGGNGPGRTVDDAEALVLVAGTLTARSGGRGRGGLGTDFDLNGGLIPELAEPIAANEARTYTHEGCVFRLRNCVVGRVEPGYIHPRQCRNSKSSNQLGIKPDAKVADALTSEGPGAVLVPELKIGSGGTCGNPPAIVFDPTQVTSPENRGNPQPDAPCHTLAKGQAAPCVAFSTKESGRDASVEVAPTLRAESGDPHMGGRTAVAFSCKDHGADAGGQVAIRRLTPTECERLMGLPDDYTLIPRGKKGKPAADGPRYRAIGNSMAVPVMRWIGERLRGLVFAARGALSRKIPRKFPGIS